MAPREKHRNNAEEVMNLHETELPWMMMAMNTGDEDYDGEY